LIQDAPAHAAAYIERARVHESLGMWDEAAVDYAAAIGLGSDNESLRLARGHCLVRSGIETIVPAGSTWRWHHLSDGSDPAMGDKDFHTTFYQFNYDDSPWRLGEDSIGEQGGFGYGDPVGVDIGEPIKENRTAYFRHAFQTAGPYRDLLLSLQRDDGVIIYLDGKEVARDNMPIRSEPSGNEAFELLAEGSADDETAVRRIPLPATLAAGKHILALSLHNRAIWSGDLRIAEISLAGHAAGNIAQLLDDPQALIDRGRALIELHRFEQAGKDFRRAQQLGATVPDRLIEAAANQPHSDGTSEVVSGDRDRGRK